ncbi:hypothetical protein [Halomicrococcus sp. SG-WS-1]|uniref:hypothetical protein n=1 Tax=Halomicrococcus sp. SG-WS-1 TaxID=3439057 RepID=UPI003F7A5CD9
MERELSQHLERLSQYEINGLSDFSTFESEALKLIEILGYPDENIFYGMNADVGVDCIVARNLATKPYLATEVKFYPRGKSSSTRFSKTSAILSEEDAEYGLLITNVELVIFEEGDQFARYDLKSFSKEDAKKVVNILSYTGHLPEESAVAESEYVYSSIEYNEFEIDGSEYNSLLKQMREGPESDKGDKLEDLAAMLISGVEFLNIRERNDRTSLGEFDIVAEYVGSRDITLFDDFNRFIPIECKNWGQSVGVGEVSKFINKMKASKSNLGIIFAQEGVSGENDGRFAKLLIDNHFQDGSDIILIIRDDDLDKIGTGANFYSILDEKVYRTKFPE